MSPPQAPAAAEIAAAGDGRAAGRATSWLWAAQVALLLGAAAWIAVDGQFMRPAEQLPATAAGQAKGPQTLPMSTGRLVALWVVGLAAVTTLALVFVGLFFGAPRHRRITSWLAIVALTAAWLGLLTSWPDLQWAGQRWRLQRHVATVAPLAGDLRRQWPTADGSHELLGPFSAYPAGSPRMLMPLTRRAATTLDVAAVERAPQGGVRLQLVGREAGAWLEWHPAGERPASFTGGLDTPYRLERAADLGDGWFAARYGSGVVREAR